MATRESVTALLVGVAAGLVGGLFGVGGGIVLVPLLTGVLGLSQHQAHGTSLAAIGATALASLIVYGAHGNVAWGTAALVGGASMLTARYGARLAARTSTRNLRLSFALFLVLIALRLLWKAPVAASSPFHGAVLAVGFDLLLGAVLGVLAGFMGVGGGILAVPAFALVLGMSQPAAQGTSLAVILLTAPAGAFEHHRHGNVALWLAQWLPPTVLTRAFAVFLLANVIHLWAKSGPAGSGGRA
jgi:uncharacterized membrane protein YfcA